MRKIFICELGRAARLRKMCFREELLIRGWGPKIHVLEDRLPLGSAGNRDIPSTEVQGRSSFSVIPKRIENVSLNICSWIFEEARI